MLRWSGNFSASLVCVDIKTGKLKERLVVPMKKLQGQVVSATEPVKDPAKALEVDTKYEIIEIIYKDKSILRP